jgi:hypothetical protein
MIKEILLVFFCGLGIFKVSQDVFKFFNSDYLPTNSSGYFTVLGFMVLFFGIKYLSKKNSPKNNSGNAVIKS